MVASTTAVPPASADEAEADAEAMAAPVRARVGPGAAAEELLQRQVLSCAELSPAPPPHPPLEEGETWVVAYERVLAMLEETVAT